MITTVTQKNMVSVPAELSRQFGIKPGFRFDWEPAGVDEIRVRVIPDRGALAQRLMGALAKYSPDVNAVDQLVEARGEED